MAEMWWVRDNSVAARGSPEDINGLDPSQDSTNCAGQRSLLRRGSRAPALLVITGEILREVSPFFSIGR